MMDQETFDILRIVLECLGGISLILFGNKYDMLLTLAKVLISSIEQANAKEVKALTSFGAQTTGTDLMLDKILEAHGYLGRSKNEVESAGV